MGWIEDALAQATRFSPLALTAALVIGALWGINRQLRARWHDRPDVQFRFQLTMLLLTLAGVVALVVALPVSDKIKGDLLGLLGIVLSASIALASTTFMGNMMAGIMLRVIRNARPGDFVTVGEVTGRVTEMGLLRTEVQTEDRDLVTLPNLVLVTQPVKVVRASGTIVGAEVSLGYDVERERVTELLLQAAERAGLKDGYVLVRELGDYSILYRVAGLLEDVTSLISARSRLREAMLDALHGGGVEIVSPRFVNQRVLDPELRFVPKVVGGHVALPEGASAEALAFDKADEAASIEELRATLAEVEAALAEAEGDAAKPIAQRRDALKARLQAQLDAKEEAKD